MFFQNRSRGLFLEGPSADLYRKIRFWYHFRFSVFPKTFLAQKSTIRCPAKSWSRPCRDPAFHEPLVITLPLGPTGFKKVAFLLFQY